MKNQNLVKSLLSILSVSAVMIVAGVATSHAQSSNAKIIEQITKLEAENIEAVKRQNPDDFDRFHATDYMATSRVPARVGTRNEILAKMRDPNFKRDTIDSLTKDDVKVRVYGDDTAIVTAAWKRVSRAPDGKDTSMSGRLTHVWVKQNGKWQMAAAHYSPDVDLEKLKMGQASAGEKKN